MLQRLRWVLVICFVISVSMGGALWAGRIPETEERVDNETPAAQWIWLDQAGPVNSWVSFRKTFDLPFAPEQAVARIAADSKYWLWVNGRLVVFDGSMPRGPVGQGTYYDTVDLEKYLREGQNTVAILVWYWGRTANGHVDSGQGGLFFDAQMTGAEELASAVLVSDASWKVSEHPGYDRGVQPGLRLFPQWDISYSARTGEPFAGWQGARFDDSLWPSATVKGPEDSAPWGGFQERPIPLLRFSSLRNYENESVMPAQGQGGDTPIKAALPYAMQVTPFFRVRAPAGETITITADSTHAQVGEWSAMQTTYVTTGGEQEFESLGWMAGEEIWYYIPSNVEIISLGYRESRYPAVQTGSFVSNDAFFNTLWQKAARGVAVNLREDIMDCPDRERGPWIGDAVNDAFIGVYVFDSSWWSLVEQTYARFGLRPDLKDGSLLTIQPSEVPLELPMQNLAAIAGLWRNQYMYTGQPEIIRSVYRALKNYVLSWKIQEDGLVAREIGDWDWFDWGDSVDAELLTNSWYSLALDSLIHMASIAGDIDTSELIRRQNSIADNFERFWDEEGKAYRSPVFRGTQVFDERGNALAIIAGLVPVGHQAAVAQILRREQNASPYMELYVLEAMYQLGDAAGAEARMKERYAGMVQAPGSTLWEDWYLEPVPGRTMNSSTTVDHGWSGGPLYVLSAYGMGLRPLEPGWTRFSFEPQISVLTSVQADVPVPQGTISASVERKGSVTALSLASPIGTLAEVAIPWGEDEPQVSINGTVFTWQDLPGPDLPGVSRGRVTPAIRYLVLEPGQWEVVVTATGYKTDAASGTGVSGE